MWLILSFLAPAGAGELTLDRGAPQGPPAEPTACDPTRNTASVSKGGFCLTEEEWIDWGRLHLQVQALDAELAAERATVQALEDWKLSMDATWLRSMAEVRQSSLATLSQQQASCAVDVSLAKRRTFWERYGTPIGFTGGFVAATVTAGFLIYAANGL